MQIVAEVYHNLKVVITEKYGLAGVCEILASPAISQYVATDGQIAHKVRVLVTRVVSPRLFRRQKKPCSCWSKLQAVLGT